MYKLPPAIITASILCLLFASSATLARELLLIDESLNVLPSDYLLYTVATANATAELQIGALGTSNGLIYDGSWNVPANGSEYSTGLLYLSAQAPEPYLLDPSDIEGISSVHWTLDTEVISTTMSSPDQGIFVSLLIYQQQSDGSDLGFDDDGNLVVTGQSVYFDITLTESDFGPPGGRPDFSATGRPMYFALKLGATYPKVITPQAFFVDGRMTAKNWTVSVTDGGGIFSDSFESSSSPLKLTPGLGPDSAKLTDTENCPCLAPPPEFNR